MRLEPGTRLGPYDIQSGIGAGGMGEVYRARDRRLERDVAIKVLPAQFAPGSRQLKQFELEARLLASLNHPSICAIYDIGADNGVSFIVMEHLRGETLAARINRGPIAVNVALHYAIQIAEALQAAHGANVIHRDIKPGNIMLTTMGIKLLDFGLAKRHMSAAVVSSMSGATTNGLVDTGVQEGIVGTLHYMAPEQLSGGIVDARSDIWAFGCVIYEMVAGRRAFSGTLTEVIAAIVADRPPAWTIEHGVAPIALEHVVAKCLSRNPADRWQSVADLKKELESIVPHAKENASAAGASRTGSGSGSGKVPSQVLQGLQTGTQQEQQGEEPAKKRVSVKLLAAAAAALLVVGALAWQFGGALIPRKMPVVAVLPFVNAAPADAEYWSAGLTEGVTGDLAHNERLRAISSSVAFGYKPSDPQAAGQSLGADRLVTGRVEIQSGRLVVDAALVAVPGGGRIWTGHYSESFAQAPALQRALTADILKALGIRPAGNDVALSTLPSQVNADAYSLLLQGWTAAHRHDERSLRSAIALFNQAAAKDARLASAFAGVARAYSALARYPFEAARPGDALPNAKAAAIKALELDPTLADAHDALGFAKSVYEWDWQGAGAEFERAVALRPNDPAPRQWHAEWLMTMARTEEALEEARTAAHLDPQSADASLDLAWQMFLARRYDEAIEQLKTIPRGHLEPGAGDWALGVVYGEGGRRDEAVSALRAATAAAPSQPAYLAALAYAEARAQKTADAKQLLERLHEMAGKQYVSPYDLALVAMGLDDYPQAFSSLQLAVEEHASAAGLLAADPRLDALRSDPRFKELLKRAGL